MSRHSRALVALAAVTALTALACMPIPAQPLPWRPTLAVTAGGAIGEPLELTFVTTAGLPSVIAASTTRTSQGPFEIGPPYAVVFVGTAPASQAIVVRVPIPAVPTLIGAPIYLQGASSRPVFPFTSASITWHVAPNLARRFTRVRPTPPSIAPGGSGRAITTLADGTFLITGGAGGGDVLPRPIFKTALHYDATNDVVTRLPDLAQARAFHSAVRLADGTVLVVGGDTASAAPIAELFDPATMRFTTLGPAPALVQAMCVPFRDAAQREWVLYAGGYKNGISSADAFLFDTSTRTFTTLPRMTRSRGDAAAVAVPGGVMISGGYTSGSPNTFHASVELFSIQSRSFHPWGALAKPRVYHSMRSISPTAAIVVGGRTVNWGPCDDVEVFEGLTARSTRLPMRLRVSRTSARLLPLPDGSLFVGSPGPRTCEILSPTATTLLRPIPEVPLIRERIDFLPAPGGGVLAMGPQTMFVLR